MNLKSKINQNFLKSFFVTLAWTILILLFVSIEQNFIEGDITIAKVIRLLGFVGSIAFALFISVTMIRYFINRIIFDQELASKWTQTFADLCYVAFVVLYFKLTGKFSTSESVKLVFSYLLLLIPLIYFGLNVFKNLNVIKPRKKTSMIIWATASITYNYGLFFLLIFSIAYVLTYYLKLLKGL